MGGLLTLMAACSDNPMAPDLAVDPGPPSQSPSTPSAGEGSAPAPAPAPAPTTPNPLQGATLFVESNSNAAKQAAEWRATRPADAAQMDKIAGSSQAIWFGDWNPEPYDWVSQVTRQIRSQGALPVYVLYNIPKRDCGLYSSGGARDAGAYQRWISEVARAIGNAPAVVVLEPDAVAGLDCLSAGDQAARLTMIRDAVGTLKKSGSISVYIDAGNARWHAADAIGKRLFDAGIADADGFSLNVSNFLANDENVRYGEAVSKHTGGKHFVVDTSRNGAGPAADLNWCNPTGRGLGARPTTSTGHPLVDAFLWIKSPGESDGECNGGPSAGVWWPEYALGLAQRSSW